MFNLGNLILHIVYIYDMCNISKILKFILFEDDTNIFDSGKNIQQAENVITTELLNLTVVRFKVNNSGLKLINCR